MKLSTKGRYAVMAMIELALHDKKGLLPLAELSLAQDISISYLEQLFARLRSADLVTGVRGPRGGYRLAQPANEITLAQVVRAVDEKAGPAHTQAPARIESRGQLTTALWNDVSRRLYSFLNGITLTDVVTNADVYARTASASGDAIASRPTTSSGL